MVMGMGMGMAITRTSLVSLTLALALPACGGGGGGSTDTGTTADDPSTGTATADTGTTTTPTGTAPTTGDPPTTGDSATGTATTGEPLTGTSEPLTGTSAPATDSGTGSATDTGSDTGSTTAAGCGPCDQPNQQCIDNECITGCQGVEPDPCGPAQVCDVISGECKDPDAACTLDGANVACGAGTCGPGSVCDGVDTCLPIAPCASVACTDAGECWGTDCVCDRAKDCTDPSLELLNGPFSTEIGGIDFADDCTAWMVTLRSGTDYLRRLKPDGELTQWAGVANLNMGEVKVLRSLTIPQLTVPLPFGNTPTEPQHVEGLGEVAITYTCCDACGCQADPPQGVARLVEEDPNKPLPIVIVAEKTQGTGPFGSVGADAGPHGLTWGVDRVLYVG
jgi:hypothetical protein